MHSKRVPVRFPSVLVTVCLLAACGGGGGGGSGGTPIPTPTPVATPPPGATPTPAPTGAFADFEREIQAFVDERDDVDGAGAIVVDRERGVVYRRAFGSFSEDRVYLIASSSKMITAGVLLRLADQGLLDLDAPLADAVPWGAGNPSVTPAQLLSNSSGLVGLFPTPAYAPYVCQYVFGGTIQDCARQIFTSTGDDRDVIPPDTGFRYGGA
ncbi:MAG: serine hydrolase domain-containing protein, partial [Alphaproteobacteria bacterium]